MKLSIIVPAFNEEQLLAGTLRAIGEAAQALPFPPEVIVCDNNSTDRTADIARAHGATVVFEPVNQISRARNAGAAAATGDWLLFIDADCAPTRALFQEMLLAARNCIGGGSTVTLETSDRLVNAVVGVWNLVSRTALWAAGSFVFCRADAFRAVGGFSTELYASEEIDFSRRIKQLGRFVILHRHPLRTSGRKAHLYSKAEHFGFIFSMLASRGKALRDRKASFLWYDGRR